MDPATPTGEGERADRGDSRLAPFLAAGTEDRAREILGRLVLDDVSPVVWKVVRRQLGWRRGGVATELEDVHAGVLLRVTQHLLALRGDATAAVPASLADYVAVTAYNACASFQEQKHPLRTRLRYRLRYVLQRDRHLALWEAAPREWCCGLAAHRAAAALGDVVALAEAAGDALAREGRSNADLPRALRALFDGLGQPCHFGDLVEAMAGALGIGEAVVGSESAALAAADRAPSSLDRVHGRQVFERLWSEIQELPRAQRVALLLNLRDAKGQDVIGFLVLAGTATVPRIAALLELPTAAVAELIPSLPRDDRAIAELLGVTPRQVINLRKSARARLGRRLRDLGAGW